ncbi:hypothetical protein ACFQXB_05915 [Plastorhodobacter daqingensis]|uniref:PDZ domain-containing protein n=1 Tax=Plastorhodobacter daqingensis TaxID=1387281 RepID=A0ABW2UJW9_9RHOB
MLKPNPGRTARAFGLRGGDVLIGLDGAPFRGTPDVLAVRMAPAAPGREVALTLWRDGRVFSVLAPRPDLGHWAVASSELCSRIGTEPDLAEAAERPGLRSWELWCGPARNSQRPADLLALGEDWLAVALPPLWMLNRRLWTPFVAVVLACLATALVSPFLALLAYGLVMLCTRRARLTLLRGQATTAGLGFWMVIAAHDEREAQNVAQRLDPALCFRWGAKPVAVQAPSLAEIG